MLAASKLHVNAHCSVPCCPGSPTTQSKAYSKYSVAPIPPVSPGCCVIEIQEAWTRDGKKGERLLCPYASLHETG